ncbi:MAG: hypothetical protein BWY93_00829 [Euryarchaeota archaeon ADurb.BinA087]|nr:MAG: hypothetical protein BWY93_00829 [Euryarchaeota archaeon ADurb.BinA087]
MAGNTGKRDLLAGGIFRTGGKGYFELTRDGLGITAECLVEVADMEEVDSIPVLLLDRPVLGHRRSQPAMVRSGMLVSIRHYTDDRSAMRNAYRSRTRSRRAGAFSLMVNTKKFVK